MQSYMIDFWYYDDYFLKQLKETNLLNTNEKIPTFLLPSLRFPVLCFPQVEDTGAQVSAFLVESCFISCCCRGYGSVNDTSFQLVN